MLTVVVQLDDSKVSFFNIKKCEDNDKLILHLQNTKLNTSELMERGHNVSHVH